MAEKLESVISRGEASTRPRDRYDLFIIWKLRKDEVDFDLLSEALTNTVTKRDSLESLTLWPSQIAAMKTSDYQKQLWTNYQRTFKYAGEISFEESVDIVSSIMDELTK